MSRSVAKCTIRFDDLTSPLDLPEVDEAVTVLWREAAEFLSERIVTFGDKQVRVLADWKRASSRRRPRTVNFVFEGHDLGARAEFHLGEAYLSLVFLALNLAVPGAANFLTLRMSTRKETHDVSWPSSLFDGIWVYRRKWPWAVPKFMALEPVWNWLQTVHPLAVQVAGTPVQRALFSLLHAVKDEHISPMVAVWLTAALEALYDAPPEGIGRTLRSRIGLVLGSPWQSKAALRQVSSLYAHRSSVAHGTFEVAHPLQNDILDPSIGDQIHGLDQVHCFGCTAVVMTLQAMIERGWYKVEFIESVRGA